MSCESKINDNSISQMVEFMGITESFELGVAIGCDPGNDTERTDAALKGIVEVLSLVA